MRGPARDRSFVQSVPGCTAAVPRYCAAACCTPLLHRCLLYPIAPPLLSVPLLLVLRWGPAPPLQAGLGSRQIDEWADEGIVFG